ncbi:phosphatidylinositol-4- kinase [Arachnomyces sp. PD_36]|nr:phosphatidylinositol-4- kinase [Arachnomyces sp. PD_36]
MDTDPRSIRRAALDKLALLAAKSPDREGESDIDRLKKACSHPKTESNGFLDDVSNKLAPTSRMPMSIRELDVLLALCQAAPSVTHRDHAKKLVSQLAVYLPESHSQSLRSSPFLHNIKPSPWEVLTYNLTLALLSLASNHATLRPAVAKSIAAYIQRCLNTTDALSPNTQDQQMVNGGTGDIKDAAGIASITVSLVGFLEASAVYGHFWSTGDRVEIISQLRTILSEEFLVTVETASSSIRNSGSSEPELRDWRRYARRYAAHGRPLGAMLLQQSFMQFTQSCTSSLVLDGKTLQGNALLDRYMEGKGITKPSDEDEYDIALVEFVVELVVDEMHLLDDGADYLQIGSAWQQQLAFSVRSSALVSFLNCVIIDEESADVDTLLTWLEETLANPVQMASEQLSPVVLKCMAVVARLEPSNASNLARALLRFIVHGSASGATAAIAAQCLSQVLGVLSQDAVITTLYSLGNVLSSGPGTNQPSSSLPDDGVGYSRHLQPQAQPTNGSLVSLPFSGEEETSVTYSNVVHAITTIATNCDDGNIIELSQSMLRQKIGRIGLAVDSCIIQESAALALSSSQSEFQLLLKFYNRLWQDGVAQNNTSLHDAVNKARIHLSTHLQSDSQLCRIYLVHLLESIVNKGDVSGRENDTHKDVELSAEDITPFLKPLALLLSTNTESGGDLAIILKEDEDISVLFRDTWFNFAVHEIFLSSKLCEHHHQDLVVITSHAPPLVAENRAELLESDVELNIVLRRGMSPQHTAEQKKNLIAELPGRDSDIKRLSYPKAVFLNAVLLIESLRAKTANCTKILTYFLDPAVSSSELGNCVKAIADKVVLMYLERSLSGKYYRFSAPYIAHELADMFTACCHRIEKVRQVAAASANKVVSQTPSALCDKKSLFTLLELLTIMWSSCLEGELDEFEWNPSFASQRGIVKVQLSDNYDTRKRTLDSFYRLAKSWVATVMNIAPLDVKGLLQTYLSDHEDDGAYGQVSMGRSFALEMGSIIPSSDQRLGSIGGYGGDAVNGASDFVAQYTTRQEYRYSERPLIEGAESTISLNSSEPPTSCLPIISAKSLLAPNGRMVKPGFLGAVQDIESSLGSLHDRVCCGEDVPIVELRHALRRAASLLCSSNDGQPTIIYHLVDIPFQIFSKDSINLGISLWLGVIHENPYTEPRILTEVAQAWERTINRKLGMFDPEFNHPDPFFTTMEFLPSDKASTLKRQQLAQNILSPHFRILQFFESHFNAIRLGSVHTQKVFGRLVSTTLVGLTETNGHPLAREIHFHIVLFGLRILQFSTSQSRSAVWKLKDQILSSALSWFKHPPRWSFGGNRLQIKAEDKILDDVEAALESVSQIGASTAGSRKSLRPKHDLARILLASERSRLKVWLFPLEQEKRHYISSGTSHVPNPDAIIPLLRLAWTEHPVLAIQLAARFPSAKLSSNIRWLLLNFPEKALDEAASLELLFGTSLPQDVSFQLKYLLYWAPVNPMEAVTYFLPAYANHPFIMQYAMRALESHSVDVRFFYVPQLVQALRYDRLGYVERYIFETAHLSQLFAHQVIWNMKANAYKDEESQVPDPLKPTLDKLMESLTNSFSDDERDFYEREFSFFHEITDVSGKLRPYIKKSKPEKKQKIEEELRKIKVEVGVYLPSNPDGVVVGIDRKSGKPLQSHAKAPYMATFRIRKTKQDDAAGTGAASDALERRHSRRPSHARGNSVLSAPPEGPQTTYEVWQSAIFKVGDDCRQDVLALQMIATFRNIFSNVGLDVFVYPYRVTATAPGCGVIDVLPNSISRDMLGREAVNGLYDYFISKYGGEESTRFQEARTNFVKSMAAYSVISYLLQFKDRHNGNIMIDEAGHIIHIDFGFCFDIVPGGVRFERAPFKLTSEMIAVMGGTGGSSNSSGGFIPGTSSHDPTTSQAFRWFESLTIKAFLASRPYMSKLAHLVTLMLDSGLPCFKTETLSNFHDRFVLEKSEREAADFMRELIRKSYASYSTKGYDQFQLLTNGIPY